MMFQEYNERCEKIKQQTTEIYFVFFWFQLCTLPTLKVMGHSWFLLVYILRLSTSPRVRFISPMSKTEVLITQGHLKRKTSEWNVENLFVNIVQNLSNQTLPWPCIWGFIQGKSRSHVCIVKEPLAPKAIWKHICWYMQRNNCQKSQPWQRSRNKTSFGVRR